MVKNFLASRLLLKIGSKIPPRNAVVPVFGLIIFTSYTWSIYWFVLWLGGWNHYLTWAELSLFFAGIMVNDFAESCVILLIPLILSIILPAVWFREKFLSMSGSILCILNVAIFGTNDLSTNLLVWYSLFALLAIILCVLIYRVEKLEKIIKSVVERFAIFTYFYLPLSLIGGLAIIISNIISQVSV